MEVPMPHSVLKALALAASFVVAYVLIANAAALVG
jgi:hypothetical protein